MDPGLVIVNADVRTAAGAPAEALGWRDGRIFACGGRERVLAAAGAGAKVWDAGGVAVLPGFIDAHHHASLVGLYGCLPLLAPPRVTDIPSLQALLASQAKTLP